MSSMEVSIHWFIARDGRQHGPVSDMEMRKLVELGHLRHTDLLWRQGFPDWRPAPAVFVGSPQGSSPNAAPTATERPRQQGASPSLMPRFEATAGRGALSGASATAAAAAAANGTAMHQAWNQGGPQNGGTQAANPQAGAQNSPQPSLHQLSSGPGRQQPYSDPRSNAQFGPGAFQPQNEPRFDAAPNTGYRPTLASPTLATSASAAPAVAMPRDPARPKTRQAIIAVVAILTLAGGGWYAAMKQGTAIKAIFALKSSGKTIPPVADAIATGTPSPAPAAVAATTPKAAETVAVALTAPPPASVAAIEAKLQTVGFWKVIAAEFPDWYREKVDAAARLSADGKTEVEVNKNLVQALVELRRNQAEAALRASNATLKTLATAFKATVTRMGKEGTATCMGFIMAGESNDSVVSMMTDPTKNSEVNAHLLAIFNAVVEGRKAATAHADPADGDYKLLVAELVKGGWTQAELELFADPKGASRTTPERYCQMMQDFFAAHLTIPDAAVQDRLLHRTLKLVVAG